MMGGGMGLETEMEPDADTGPVTQEGGHGVTSSVPGPKKEVTKTSSAPSEAAASEKIVINDRKPFMVGG